jgi:anti-sigma factor RsiW
MVDRQDIDALLVGALYGELTPADEARLAAHLESHPADRAALEDLKTARHAVKQSRIFEIQDEPPQAVSALLLQEAHRRAPSIRSSAARAGEESEGWFARLTRSFLAHPAMAAAAMLVLVVGVAGTLYLRKGGSDELVYNQTAPTSPTQGAAQAAADNAPELDTGAAGAPGAGSGYAVQLDETNKEEAKKQLQQLDTQRQKQAEQTIAADKADGDGFGGVADRKIARPTSKPPVVTPRVPEPQPKDLAEAPKAHKGAAPSQAFNLSDGALSRGATGGGASAASGRDQAAMAPAGEAAPAPAAAPPPPPKASVAAPAPGRNDAKSDPVFAWAQKQLAQAIQLTRDNKCKEAAKIAMDIRSTAPAFYNENVADNRELKRCATYIRNNVDENSDRAKKMSPAKASDSEMMH